MAITEFADAGNPESIAAGSELPITMTDGDYSMRSMAEVRVRDRKLAGR